MNSTSVAMIVPPAAAMTASRTLTNRVDRSPNPRSWWKTRTNITTVRVSTANWVMARSGAPNRM